MKLISLGAAMVVAAAVYSAAPTTPPQVSKPPAVTRVNVLPPFRGTVFYDVTMSRNKARIAPSLDDLTPLFDRLKISGGELGFGLIREDSDRPLLRCYVSQPPEPPTFTAPHTNGNVFVNANQRKRDDAERRAYEAKRRVWEADATTRIHAFVAAITPLVEAAADAPSTDLTDAVERGDLMLAEPSDFPTAAVAIILVTDGFHNATAKTTPTLRSNAQIAVVNGIGSLGTLAKLTPTPLRFESVAAAARYFARTGGAHGR